MFINNEPKIEKIIDTKGEWTTVTYDLMPYTNKDIDIRIENSANGWSYEAIFRRGERIAIVTPLYAIQHLNKLKPSARRERKFLVARRFVYKNQPRFFHRLECLHFQMSGVKINLSRLIERIPLIVQLSPIPCHGTDGLILS